VAATAEYAIVFDGGALGNPGKGYGSFQILGADGVVAHERLEYGDRVTNNQAEYRTLIAALERLQALVPGAVSGVAVRVRGDSSLVVNQVNGRWKVKHPDLQPLHRRAVELLRGFGRADVQWHRRDASVRVLGH
jgi:probable phosphoglycerate mutase